MGTLRGLAAIATALDLKYDAAKYLAATGAIPVFHIGKRICSTKALLVEWQAAKEEKARADYAAHRAI